MRFSGDCLLAIAVVFVLVTGVAAAHCNGLNELMRLNRVILDGYFVAFENNEDWRTANNAGTPLMRYSTRRYRKNRRGFLSHGLRF